MFTLYDGGSLQARRVLPGRDRQLRMYSCGPQGNRQADIGDLRSFVLPDLIRRNAERHRLTVITCRSIDDAGYRAAGGPPGPGGPADAAAQPRSGSETAAARGRDREDAFRADCTALNVRPPDYEPRASESIGLTTDLIGQLIDAGLAYPAGNGAVYLAAQSSPAGSALPAGGPAAGIGTDCLRADSARGADIALWNAAPAAGELSWQAPWGSGAPGRAAQCSAMSLHYLGQITDIHTGCISLAAGHACGERAVCRAVAGHEVILHRAGGELVTWNGRPMAAPPGRTMLLADLGRRGLDPLALRLAFLEHRYREPVNLDWTALTAADRTLRRWQDRVADWATAPSAPMRADAAADIAAAFDDDLDTPAALRALQAIERDTQIPPGSKFETFAHADQLLALDLTSHIGRPEPASSGPAK